MNFKMEKIGETYRTKLFNSHFQTPAHWVCSLHVSVFLALLNSYMDFQSHSESLLTLAWKVWFSESGQLESKCSWTSSFLVNKSARGGCVV